MPGGRRTTAPEASYQAELAAILQAHRQSFPTWPTGTAGALVISALACSAWRASAGGQDPPAFASLAGAWARQVVAPTSALSAERPPSTALLRGASSVEPQARGAEGAAAKVGACSLVGLAVVALGTRAQARAAAARRQLRSGPARTRTTRCRAAGDELNEAELMFREAYEAESERTQLLKLQLEAALTSKLQADQGGDSGVRITVDAASTPLSPEEPGGKATWREAYEAVKARASSLENQLKKATAMGTAPRPPPPAPASAAPAAAEAEVVGNGTQAKADSEFKVSSPFGGFMDGDTRDKQGFQRLEELAQKTIEDEAALRLIAVPILGRRLGVDSTAVLPPASQVRDILGSDKFSTSEVVEFQRVYVLKGSVVKGVLPGDALEDMRARLADRGYGESTELFLQRSREEGQSVLFLMLKEDLPQNEFAWWQWVLCVALLLASLASVNITTFSVVAMSQMNASSMDINEVTKIALKTVPTAVAIFATVAAQEAARRVAASKYDVQLTPPFFIPVWPFPSVGCFGAITRRLGTVPNEEASLAMSVASGLAGYAVSFAVLFYGLSLGPDPDKIVNLNFQLLPLLLKLVLKPVLGQSSVSDQPDPFADPISIAFPSNPYTIGGIIGLIVVSLNLLPIGRLDGGILVKSILGGRNGGFVGFGALFLLLLGSLAPNDAGLIYITFGFFAIIFQSGGESPPRDSVTEADGTLKTLASLLLILGTVLSLPGALLPNL